MLPWNPADNIDDFGPKFAALLDAARPDAIGEGAANGAALNELHQLTVKSAFAHTQIVDRQMAACCLSAVWLHHNFLDQSHTISQDIHTWAGSYWHGIMHRREGDFSNAKYWFRQAADHEFESQMATACESHDFLEFGQEWDACAFVDLCRRPDDEAVVLQLAQLEWWTLFDHCYRAARFE